MKTKEDVQTIKLFFKKDFKCNTQAIAIDLTCFLMKKTNKIKSICHIKKCCTYSVLDWIIKLAFQCPNMLIPQVLK